jgi:uncharacterized protein (TIGR03382 family)
MAKLLALVVLAAGCAPYEPDFEEGEVGVWRPGLTVSQAGGCSTTIVAGLSKQLIAEQNCIRPDALVSFAGMAGLSLGAAVNPFLEPPARDALGRAVATMAGTVNINSALRTLAQQYLLYKWQGTCGITIAASPGRSNHETGIALDVGNYAEARTALEAQGWAWYGTGDAVHFDYRGPGALDLRGDSVLAFQRLWNLNHPSDLIAEDGDYGPQTEMRLAQSPADGFAIGSSCGPLQPPPDPEPSPEPTPDPEPTPEPEVAPQPLGVFVPLTEPTPEPTVPPARVNGGCSAAGSNPAAPLAFFLVVALWRRRR